MGPFSDPVPLPEPAWLVGHSDPVVEQLLEELDDDEARRLYREYLADEVRAMRRTGILRAWHAFDRAMCEILRRNKEGRGS
jgi:hypothetical protein